MFVRTVGERDLAAVRALLVETWHATYDRTYGEARVTRMTDAWHSIEALRARLAQPRSEFVVADDGAEIAGMAFAAADESGKTVTLRQLYVRPDRQGRGIGGMLLDEVVESFPDANMITLEVDPDNAKAIAFYEAQGFVHVGATPHCGGDELALPALIYERRLI